MIKFAVVCKKSWSIIGYVEASNFHAADVAAEQEYYWTDFAVVPADPELCTADTP